MPDEPAEIVKIELWLPGMVKDDLKTGKIADWRMYCNGFNGYAIREDKVIDRSEGLLHYF